MSVKNRAPDIGNSHFRLEPRTKQDLTMPGVEAAGCHGEEAAWIASHASAAPGRCKMWVLRFGSRYKQHIGNGYAAGHVSIRLDMWISF